MISVRLAQSAITSAPTASLLHWSSFIPTYGVIRLPSLIWITTSTLPTRKTHPLWGISRSLAVSISGRKDLSIQVEYNGGLGLYKDLFGDIRGYGIEHAALVGLNYCLHTADYKNIFNLEILFKYIVDEYNMWQVKDGSGQWIRQAGNQIPLQFTFVWGCDDFCTAPGLRFSGFLDIWGQKLLVPDYQNGTYTDPTQQSFVFFSEPQLWYNIGRWFKCPNLNIGTEIEFSYNFIGKGFMCNPCLGIKWCFD